MFSLRTLAPMWLLVIGSSVNAQSGTIESPYSAYAFGDLQHAVRSTQGLMAGAGIAFTERFAVLADNPASFAALLRPNFEVNVVARSNTLSSATASSRRDQVAFNGLAIGVPFGRGRWGLAFGLSPFSDVSYGLTERVSTAAGEVKRSYTGSGGLDRVQAGLARSFSLAPLDSLGNLGARLRVGGNFNFLFGGVEQTRDAVYPTTGEFSQFRSFSSLVLRAPAADLGFQWEGDLTRKRHRDDDNWRYTVGGVVNSPIGFNATYTSLVSSYALGTTGLETLRDSVEHHDGIAGRVEVPLGFGFGLSVHNSKWMFTAEMRTRDWAATTVDVEGYSRYGSLTAATTYIAAARYQPAVEGPLYQRMVYRAGLRHGTEYQMVRGHGLNATVASLGFSVPINALQTNSFVNIGGEYGLRGTTADGLLQERSLALWVGLVITPWKLERWFQPARIQ